LHLITPARVICDYTALACQHTAQVNWPMLLNGTTDPALKRAATIELSLCDDRQLDLPVYRREATRMTLARCFNTATF
jgi:hypothetical protein